MKKHYICDPYDQRDEPLIFDWDQEAGEVSGPSAERILDLASWGDVPIYPPPQVWTLGPEPLKDKYDMAAIIGHRHKPPEDLVEYYPGRFTPEPEEGMIY